MQPLFCLTLSVGKGTDKTTSLDFLSQVGHTKLPEMNNLRIVRNPIFHCLAQLACLSHQGSQTNIINHEKQTPPTDIWHDHTFAIPATITSITS